MKKQPRDIDEHNHKMDAFEELLKVLDTEHLIRFRHRLKKVGRKRMCDILTEEIEERDSAEQHKNK